MIVQIVIKLRVAKREWAVFKSIHWLKYLSHLNVCNFWCCLNDNSIQFSIQRPIPDVHGKLSACRRWRLTDISSVSHSYLSSVFTDVEMHMTCRLHQYDSQSEMAWNTLIIPFLMTLFSQAQIRCANICSENQSHWPITPLKADWINRLWRETYWTCLFEVWQHKTQDSKQTKQDKTKQMIHNVICQQFLFGWHLFGSTLRLPFIDRPLVPKLPNNTASVF